MKNYKLKSPGKMRVHSPRGNSKSPSNLIKSPPRRDPSKRSLDPNRTSNPNGTGYATHTHLPKHQIKKKAKHISKKSPRQQPVVVTQLAQNSLKIENILSHRTPGNIAPQSKPSKKKSISPGRNYDLTVSPSSHILDERHLR